jgi:hypothetical protein
MNNKLIIQLKGGLGNQLFQVFSILSLSIDNNKEFYILDNWFDNNRLSWKNYSLFNNIKIIDKNDKYINYNEKEFKFYKINIENNKDYLFNGYFQSYKYFFNNKDKIKEIINIDYDKITEIKNKLNKYDKKILAIHMRLTDYETKSFIHPIPNIKYYKKCLNNYNLDEYQIILFSDNIEKSKNKMMELNINNFITANEIYENDEEQFLMMCLTDIRICCNSTYSLMSCYFNEIYNFNDNSHYIFPDIWLGPHGPEYNIYDLIPINNNNFEIINIYKCAVMFYHKNIQQLYKNEWIEKCKETILNQDYNNFDIFEINYGNDDYSIFENDKLINNKYYFYKKDYKYHVEAMMYLLDTCFNKYNYDIVFNTNLDDYYHIKRFSFQINDININNNVLNTTLFTYMRNDNFKSYVYDFDKKHYINKEYDEKLLNDTRLIDYDFIKNNLLNNINIYSHPAVSYTKEFWNSKDKYGNYLRYRNDCPEEDFSLWYRSIDNNIPISIVNENLLFYRVHDNQISTIRKNINNEYYNKYKNNENFQLGILLKINNDYDIIKDINNNIFPNKQKYYFIIIKEQNDKLDIFLKNNNIEKYNIKIFNEEFNLKKIIDLFDISLELNSDNLIFFKENINYCCNNINKFIKNDEIIENKYFLSGRTPIIRKNYLFN